MLCLITPAFGRYELSDICFAEHAHALSCVRNAGVDAIEVVVADDENLDIARAHGLETLERPNIPGHIGKRTNDGYEFARDIGATWAGPMDSDCWFTAQRTLAMVGAAKSKEAHISSRALTLFREDGKHRLEIMQELDHPFLTVTPIALLALVGCRPVSEAEDDWGAIATTTRSALEAAGAAYASIRVTHPNELVGFTVPQGNETSYEYWLNAYGGKVTTSTYSNTFAALRGPYPDRLVDRIESFYAKEAN